MCCGRNVARRVNAAHAATWVVVMPNGQEVSKPSEVSAKLLSARNPGSRVESR